jgi:carbon-monoxide dehydrogenase large subunit
MAAISTRFMGKRIARKEDARFLSGHGQYVDDIVLPNTLHVAFARSDIARGTITSLDVSEARTMPGVVAVYTGADLNDLVQDWLIDDERLMNGHRKFRVLADGDVRYVGDPIAMVVAESRYLAEDAIEAIVVDIDPLPPVVDYERALEPDSPLVHPDTESNIEGGIPASENPELDAVFASAPVVLTETFKQHRYATVPMENRAILASWDKFGQQLTVWISTQGPHAVRGLMARAVGIDESQVRVIMPDVGGSFGLKMNPSEEEIAVALATRLLGQPVRWTQDRRENLMSDQHAREDRVTVSFAAEEDGTLLGAKAEFVESMGAFPAAMASATVLSVMVFPGPYRFTNFSGTTQTVYTNTQGRGGYRGPWMVETVVREQMIDVLAAHLGIDPLELRRRNVIGEDEMPHAMPSGMVYDQMTAAANLEQAAEMIGYEELREEQERRRAEGRLVGIGVSLLVEPTAMAFGFMSTDGATVRIAQNGQVDVWTSSASHGQGTETTIAQVVADEFGLDITQVRVMQGDTGSAPVGPGTGGSRSAVIAGTAAVQAAHDVKARMIAIAAHSLEASADDMEVTDGRVQVAGTPAKGMGFADIAKLAYGVPGMMPPDIPLGLEATARYTPSSPSTWSNGCHIALVEIDRATGRVDIERYVVSEDCGVMINPNVVEGQIAGGIVQGLGGVLYENLPYDEAGNPLATTFVDYLLPTAAEVPIIEYGHVETPAPTNPGGHKGLGEGGAIAAPPTIINAVADALAPLGVQVRDQPLGPDEIVALINAAS